MMININQNYSQFYRGTEQIKSYGATDSKKDTLVKYEFNTVDEQGNKIILKECIEANKKSFEIYFRGKTNEKSTD